MKKFLSLIMAMLVICSVLSAVAVVASADSAVVIPESKEVTNTFAYDFKGATVNSDATITSKDGNLKISNQGAGVTSGAYSDANGGGIKVTGSLLSNGSNKRAKVMFPKLLHAPGRKYTISFNIDNTGNENEWKNMSVRVDADGGGSNVTFRNLLTGENVSNPSRSVVTDISGSNATQGFNLTASGTIGANQSGTFTLPEFTLIKWSAGTSGWTTSPETDPRIPYLARTMIYFGLQTAQSGDAYITGTSVIEKVMHHAIVTDATEGTLTVTSKSLNKDSNINNDAALVNGIPVYAEDKMPVTLKVEAPFGRAVEAIAVTDAEGNALTATSEEGIGTNFATITVNYLEGGILVTPSYSSSVSISSREITTTYVYDFKNATINEAKTQITSEGGNLVIYPQGSGVTSDAYSDAEGGKIKIIGSQLSASSNRRVCVTFSHILLASGRKYTFGLNVDNTGNSNDWGKMSVRLQGNGRSNAKNLAVDENRYSDSSYKTFLATNVSKTTDTTDASYTTVDSIAANSTGVYTSPEMSFGGWGAPGSGWESVTKHQNIAKAFSYLGLQTTMTGEAYITGGFAIEKAMHHPVLTDGPDGLFTVTSNTLNNGNLNTNKALVNNPENADAVVWAEDKMPVTINVSDPSVTNVLLTYADGTEEKKEVADGKVKVLYLQQGVTVSPVVTVALADVANGTVKLNGQDAPLTVKKDSEVTVTATPDEGYMIDKILLGEQDITAVPTFKATADCTVTVTFKTVPVKNPEVSTANEANVFKNVNGQDEAIVYVSISDFTADEYVGLGYGMKLWVAGDDANYVTLAAMKDSENAAALEKVGTKFAIKVYGSAIKPTNAYVFQPYIGTADFGSSVQLSYQE